jgi:hypothetical protein
VSPEKAVITVGVGRGIEAGTRTTFPNCGLVGDWPSLIRLQINQNRGANWRVVIRAPSYGPPSDPSARPSRCPDGDWRLLEAFPRLDRRVARDMPALCLFHHPQLAIAYRTVFF